MEYFYPLKKIKLISNVDNAVNSNEQLFLPHLAVINNSSATTNIRVAFNRSAKSSNEIS
jgi:hypothetical protein